MIESQLVLQNIFQHEICIDHVFNDARVKFNLICFLVCTV